MLKEKEENSLLVQETREYLVATAQLTKNFLEGVGLQGLVTSVSQILENPIAVVDTAFKLIAHHSDLDFDDPIWKNLILSGYSNEEYLSAAEHEESTKRCYEHEGPIILDTIIGKVSRKMLCRIVVNGHIVASLGVLQVSRPFTKTDEAIVDFACKLIAVELEKCGQYFIADSHGQEQLLYDLLTMSKENQAIMEQRLCVFKVSPVYAYHVFYIPIPVDRYFTADYIRRDLNILFPGFQTISLEENKYLVLIVDCKPDAMVFNRKTLSDYLQRNRLHAGLSDSFVSLIELQYYYECARLAYETGLLMNPGETVYVFEDYHIFIYLTHSQSSLKSSTYCHKALKIIQDYDEENGTELYQTLNLYLINMGNIKKSSETLCIHRNTMRSRMEKIIDLTNLDLEDGNEMFSLLFSYKLLEYETQKTMI